MEKGKIVCPFCGQSKGEFDEIDSKLACQCCGTTFYVETAEEFYNKLCNRLSEEERGKLEKQLKNMQNEASSKFPDKDDLLRYAQKVKEFEPDHPIANLYEVLIQKADNSKVKKYFDLIKKQSLTIETKQIIVEKFLADFNMRNHQIYLMDFLETQIKPESIEIYKNLTTALEKRIEEEDKQIYDCSLERDVFIAHSGKDIEIANEIASALSQTGRTYFLSTVNLKHGLSAKTEYDSSIKQALAACRIFLLINTKNARHISCDVYVKEIPYIKALDIASAGDYKNLPYKSIPIHIKKPRINFFKEQYTDTVQDRVVKDFFDGFEYRQTINDVLHAVEDLLLAPVVIPTITSIVVSAPVHEPSRTIPATIPPVISTAKVSQQQSTKVSQQQSTKVSQQQSTKVYEKTAKIKNKTTQPNDKKSRACLRASIVFLALAIILLIWQSLQATNLHETTLFFYARMGVLAISFILFFVSEQKRSVESCGRTHQIASVKVFVISFAALLLWGLGTALADEYLWSTMYYLLFATIRDLSFATIVFITLLKRNAGDYFSKKLLKIKNITEKLARTIFALDFLVSLIFYVFSRAYSFWSRLLFMFVFIVNSIIIPIVFKKASKKIANEPCQKGTNDIKQTMLK